MLLWNILGFILAGAFLVIAAQKAVQHVSAIARQYRLSEFVVSFIIVGFVSTFPEFFVLIMSAFNGVPELGLGTVLGNNVTDLTLVLGLVVLAGGTLALRAKTVEHDLAYMLLVTLPALVALDGIVSRIDGVLLLGAGGYYVSQLVRDARVFHKVFRNGKGGKHPWWHIVSSVFSIGVLLIAARLVVWFSEALAIDLSVPSFLIGAVIIAGGAALPELSFALRAMLSKNPQLAWGDLMGNVVFDATIVIGVVALFRPITIALPEMTVMGLATMAAATAAITAVRTGNRVTRMEGLGLVALYLLYVAVQFLGMERVFG